MINKNKIKNKNIKLNANKYCANKSITKGQFIELIGTLLEGLLPQDLMTNPLN